MRAGDLDRRIQVVAVTTAPDMAGQMVESTTVVATVWAQCLQQSARESLASGVQQGEATAIFRIRWRGDVTTDHRVQHDSRSWNITEVREIGRRRGLDLHAVAVS